MFRDHTGHEPVGVPRHPVPLTGNPVPRWDNPAMAPQQITITRPDDWHLHVRDGAAMAAVVPHSAAQFGRAIIMPNLRPPVTTTAQAVAYRDRIRAAVPGGMAFEPLMTLYLTDNLPPEEIRRAQGGGRGGRSSCTRRARPPTATPA